MLHSKESQKDKQYSSHPKLTNTNSFRGLKSSPYFAM